MKVLSGSMSGEDLFSASKMVPCCGGGALMNLTHPKAPLLILMHWGLSFSMKFREMQTFKSKQRANEDRVRDGYTGRVKSGKEKKEKTGESALRNVVIQGKKKVLGKATKMEEKVENLNLEELRKGRIFRNTTYKASLRSMRQAWKSNNKAGFFV
jgi:hypothetical protein